MNLVFIDNQRPVTDSLIISETFGKRHADVMRAIENMECSQEFTERNFALSDYQDSTGRNLPKHIITQDGFAFLVMGFTGKEAAKFKEMYINEFNRMREELTSLARPSYMIDDPIKRAEIWISEQKERQELVNQSNINAPKVALYEVAMCAGNDQSISKVAKSLNYGPNKLFKLLREKKVLFGNNTPYQRYIDAGYFTVRQIPITRTDSIMNVTQPLVTAKGMAWIHKLLQEAM